MLVDGVVFADQPLGVELLRHVGTFALPEKVSAVLGSEDMSDVTPRANGRDGRKQKPQKYTADSVVVVSDPTTGERLLAIVVEPQGKATEEKTISWPVYATTAHKHLGDLMAISYRSKFIDGWIEQGEAIGEARGRAAGEVQAKADAILRVLKSRSLSPARGQRELIESCTDLARLDMWFDRSLTATTLDEIFEDDEG